jgi:hypothetical protein
VKYAVVEAGSDDGPLWHPASHIVANVPRLTAAWFQTFNTHGILRMTFSDTSSLLANRRPKSWLPDAGLNVGLGAGTAALNHQPSTANCRCTGATLRGTGLPTSKGPGHIAPVTNFPSSFQQ